MKKKKPSLAEIVSRNIRKARLEAGMTQKELADKAGFKVSYVARLETTHQNISLEVLSKLADAFGVSPESLLTEEETGESSGSNLRQLRKAMELLKRFESTLAKQ